MLIQLCRLCVRCGFCHFCLTCITETLIPFLSRLTLRTTHFSIRIFWGLITGGDGWVGTFVVLSYLLRKIWTNNHTHTHTLHRSRGTYHIHSLPPFSRFQKLIYIFVFNFTHAIITQQGFLVGIISECWWIFFLCLCRVERRKHSVILLIRRHHVLVKEERLLHLWHAWHYSVGLY